MVSFSLRQRISYPLLEDPTPVSFHLSQFVTCVGQEFVLAKWSNIHKDYVAVP